MVIFGTFFGAALFYFGDCPDFPLIKEASPWLVLLVMLWGFTMIPIGTGMDIRGWSETNPLNGPAWSLQWEYLANILYALLFRRMGKIALGCCVAFFALMTVVLSFDFDVTGWLAARRYIVIAYFRKCLFHDRPWIVRTHDDFRQGIGMRL